MKKFPPALGEEMLWQIRLAISAWASLQKAARFSAAVAAKVLMLMLAVSPIHACGAELVLQILHEFTSGPGTNAVSFPWELVQRPDGDFYASSSNGGGQGFGTIFRLTQDGSVSILVSFNGGNGKYPQEGLIEGADGNFYGTRSETIFKMAPDGDFTDLHHFACLQGEGNFPICRLMQTPMVSCMGQRFTAGPAGVLAPASGPYLRSRRTVCLPPWFRLIGPTSRTRSAASSWEGTALCTEARPAAADLQAMAMVRYSG